MAAANVEIANDFFHDAGDLLHRYHLTVDHFYKIKSKRLKLFLDLRMAAECILKAYPAYFLMDGARREEVIRRVEAYGHNVKKISTDVQPTISPELWAVFDHFVEQLAVLPVGLRYRLDGADFRELNEDFYYETVGSDSWMEALHDAVRGLREALNGHLVGHSRILSGDDLWEELKKPYHNKYAKKRGK
jgi:hypothetical protein